MSNRRRIRKTYKQEQREIIEEPEIIEEKLWSLSEWMESHWRPVVGVLGAVVVVWGGIGLYQIVSASSADSDAAANAPVYQAIARPVYSPAPDAPADDPAKPLGATFASDKERAEAAIAAAKGLEGKDKPMAELLVGAAKATLGEHEAQLAAIDAAIAAAGEGPLTIGLLAQRASALTALGRAGEAAEAWTKVANAAPTAALQGLAYVRVGDLHHPRFGKAPDAGKAKSAYEAAQKALAKGGTAPTDGNAGYLHAEASTKLAAL